MIYIDATYIFYHLYARSYHEPFPWLHLCSLLPVICCMKFFHGRKHPGLPHVKRYGIVGEIGKLIQDKDLYLYLWTRKKIKACIQFRHDVHCFSS